MGEREIFTFLEQLSERKIDSKEFNQIFSIDGIPLWYFLEGIIKSDFFPMCFPILSKIEAKIEKNVQQSLLNRLKSNFLIFALKRGVLINEILKFWISKSKKKEFESKKVLFLGYTNQISKFRKGKLESIGFEIGSENVIDALEKKGIKPLVLICDPLSKNSGSQLRKYDYLLYNYIDSEIVKESKRVATNLKNKWKEIGEKKKIKLFTFQGRNYWKFFKNEINFLFSQEVLSILSRYYFTFKKIIKNYDIQIIYLTGLTGFYESCILGLAYKLNKKIVFAPYGYGGIRCINLIRKEFRENILFMASGREEEKILREFGIKRKNIFSTGSPFFDKIIECKEKKQKKKVKKTLTLLTQPFTELGFMKKKEYFGYIRKLLMGISGLKNIERINIKLHPGERYESEYESIIRSLALVNVKLIQGAEKDILYSVLSSSDVVISFGSTADVESLLLDKNVIVIEGFTGGWMKEQPYKKAVLQIDKDDDLASVVRKVLTNIKLQRKLKQKREKYLRESYREIDGKSYERVADLVCKLLMKTITVKDITNRTNPVSD